MKKVGIITYHHYYNYGTALQAYALQKAIEGIKGYDAEIIDYRAYEEKKLSKWQMLLLRLRRMPTYFVEWKRVTTLKKHGYILSKKNLAFNKFFADDLVTGGKTFHNYRELQADAPNYDVLVTGSDQTWSPKIGFNPAMFLEFGNKNALRIAYAPSLGVSKLSDTEAHFMNVHLQPYEALSCRERLGTEVLNRCVKGKKIVNVLDPTLLLTASDWSRIAIKPKIKGDYILCYFIGHKTYYRKIAQQLSEELNLPLYYIPVSWQDLGKSNYLLDETGPKEFLGLIRDARLVLTDSFHGTAFAINFKKSFYTFTKIEGGKGASDNSRLYDILSKLHLEDRLYDQLCHIPFSDVNYIEAEKALEVERQMSLDYLNDALVDKRICTREECSGCMACVSICAHEAILIEKDLMGFRYPMKDMAKCVGCGLCQRVCPNIIEPTFKKAEKAYVAAAASDIEFQTSTSGGIASVITRSIVRNGGVVYGCTSSDANEIRHIRIDSEKDITLLKGSKYVQSDLQGVFRQVKADLSENHFVLFIGTPCQVAGLKAFLRKPYEKLITIDFVCHGVPSQQLFNDIILKNYPKYRTKRMSVQFRFKNENGNSRYGVRMLDEGNTVCYQEIYPESSFIVGYLGGLFYRESCYQCHYAKGERVSDITLGDYWDREGQFAKYSSIASHGYSMVLTNTEKGARLFSSISDNIVSTPIEPSVLMSRNGQLQRPMKRNASYNDFMMEYVNYGYNQSAAQILDKEIVRVKHNMKISSLSSKVKASTLGRMVIVLLKSIK
jgi:coenzyme F420-reducing hydrogenase beta subunit